MQIRVYNNISVTALFYDFRMPGTRTGSFAGSGNKAVSNGSIEDGIDCVDDPRVVLEIEEKQRNEVVFR